MLDNEPSQTSFNRIMLKISGEALMGDQGYGISPPTIERIAAAIPLNVKVTDNNLNTAITTRQ